MTQIKNNIWFAKTNNFYRYFKLEVDKTEQKLSIEFI